MINRLIQSWPSNQEQRYVIAFLKMPFWLFFCNGVTYGSRSMCLISPKASRSFLPYFSFLLLSWLKRTLHKDRFEQMFSTGDFETYAKMQSIFRCIGR